MSFLGIRPVFWGDFLTMLCFSAAAWGVGFSWFSIPAGVLAWRLLARNA